MTTIEEFRSGFGEEPGYLDFARLGPLGAAVIAEEQAQLELLRRVRFGSLAGLASQDERLRDAVAGLTGFRADQVVFQPDTSTGLMHAMFGLTGGVLLSPAEFPAVTFAVARAAEALGVLVPSWLEPGPVTPAGVKEHLSAKTVAVAVSLVDYRTGYLADIDGIRQVIGDRLLIVDAVQGIGVVEAPYAVADVVVAGGQKWLRAGRGTGLMVMSDRALERLTPVFSGFAADAVELPSEVGHPGAGAAAYSMSPPSPVAQARLATAIEEISAVGVPAINRAVAERVGRIIELADEFAIPVSSSRAEHERAGIVVLEPASDQFTVLVASLFNHGVSVTARQGTVRVSAHVSTTDETLQMLRSAFSGFAGAVTV